MTVTPAYGRDYKTGPAARAAWAAGKDFIIADISNRYDGKPINKEDAERAGLTIMLRFNNLTKITAV